MIQDDMEQREEQHPTCCSVLLRTISDGTDVFGGAVVYSCVFNTLRNT